MRRNRGGRPTDRAAAGRGSGAGPDVSGDLVSYLSTMPGVISIGDRGGQVFIRGGEPSHNLALLDGMYIYQPFHILGFYSAFSSAHLTTKCNT